jgi:hypothetical protein
MIELIPVIEIGYNNQGIIAPNKYPYWDNAEIWNKYHEECYLKAGFIDKLIPYLEGSSFFKISEITNENLKKLVIEHTHELRNGEYGREQSCSFFGGYVLKINGDDKYYPQCCGLLSDINYWEALSNEQYSDYEGHPAPQIVIDKKNITFDFSVDENDEIFQPIPIELRLKVDRLALKQSVGKVKQELNIFAERINRINKEENLNIENIADLLIGHYTNDENTEEIINEPRQILRIFREIFGKK